MAIEAERQRKKYNHSGTETQRAEPLLPLTTSAFSVSLWFILFDA